MNKKEFKTHNNGLQFRSSSLQGHILANYKDLKKLFGKPDGGDSYKVDAEWYILFKDGIYCTIYNYKTGKNYNGSKGTPKSKIKEWHIGGDSELSVSKITEYLTNKLGTPLDGNAYGVYDCKDFTSLVNSQLTTTKQLRLTHQ